MRRPDGITARVEGRSGGAVVAQVDPLLKVVLRSGTQLTATDFDRRRPRSPATRRLPATRPVPRGSSWSRTPRKPVLRMAALMSTFRRLRLARGPTPATWGRPSTLPDRNSPLPVPRRSRRSDAGDRDIRPGRCRPPRSPEENEAKARRRGEVLHRQPPSCRRGACSFPVAVGAGCPLPRERDRDGKRNAVSVDVIGPSTGSRPAALLVMTATAARHAGRRSPWPRARAALRDGDLTAAGNDPLV